MHTLETPYHCGCGSGVGVGGGRSGECGGCRHTAQPHNTRATRANHTHDPGLVGGHARGLGSYLGMRVWGSQCKLAKRVEFSLSQFEDS